MPDLSPTDVEPSEGELIHKWLDTQRHELQVQSERIALSEKELDRNETPEDAAARRSKETAKAELNAQLVSVFATMRKTLSADDNTLCTKTKELTH